MKRIPDRRKAHVFLVALVIIVMCLGVFNNWTLRARFNLLFHGYVFCKLTRPVGAESFPVMPVHHFVSRLVYCRGVCVGSLDPSGQFTRSDSTDPSQSTPCEGDVALLTIVVLSAGALLWSAGAITSYASRWIPIDTSHPNDK
jgi:hypothetical protein